MVNNLRCSAYDLHPVLPQQFLDPVCQIVYDRVFSVFGLFHVKLYILDGNAQIFSFLKLMQNLRIVMVCFSRDTSPV